MLSAIRFCSCRLISVDAEVERNEKARKIIKFSKDRGIRFDLKVCWYRKAGKNCSHCEKCYRTILEICSNHGNPNSFGFTVSDHTFSEIKSYLKNNYVNKGYWKPIQQHFRQEAAYWKSQPKLAWILEVKFNGPKAIINKACSVLRKFI